MIVLIAMYVCYVTLHSIKDLRYKTDYQLRMNTMNNISQSPFNILFKSTHVFSYYVRKKIDIKLFISCIFSNTGVLKTLFNIVEVQ